MMKINTKEKLTQLKCPFLALLSDAYDKKIQRKASQGKKGK